VSRQSPAAQQHGLKAVYLNTHPGFQGFAASKLKRSRLKNSGRLSQKWVDNGGNLN